jgi:hypothetical protein
MPENAVTNLVTTAHLTPHQELLNKHLHIVSTSPVAFGPDLCKELGQLREEIFLQSLEEALKAEGIFDEAQEELVFFYHGGQAFQTTAPLSDFDITYCTQKGLNPNNTESKLDEAKLEKALTKVTAHLSTLGIDCAPTVIDSIIIENLSQDLIEGFISTTTKRPPKSADDIYKAFQGHLDDLAAILISPLTARHAWGNSTLQASAVSEIEKLMPLELTAELMIASTISRRAKATTQIATTKEPSVLFKNSPGLLRDLDYIQTLVKYAEKLGKTLLNEDEKQALQLASSVMLTLKKALHHLQNGKTNQTLAQTTGLVDESEASTLTDSKLRALAKKFPNLLSDIELSGNIPTKGLLHIVGCLQIAQKTIRDLLFRVTNNSGGYSRRIPLKVTQSTSTNIIETCPVRDLPEQIFRFFKEFSTAPERDYQASDGPLIINAEQSKILSSIMRRMPDLKANDQNILTSLLREFDEFLSIKQPVSLCLQVMNRIGLLEILIPQVNEVQAFARREDLFAPNVVQHSIEVLAQLDKMLMYPILKSAGLPLVVPHLVGSSLADSDFLFRLKGLDFRAVRWGAIMHDITKHLGEKEGPHQDSAARATLPLVTLATMRDPDWQKGHGNAAYINDLVRRHHLLRTLARSDLPHSFERASIEDPSSDLIKWRLAASSLPYGAMQRGYFLEDLLLLTLADYAANAGNNVTEIRNLHEMYRGLRALVTGQSYSRETDVAEVRTALEARPGIRSELSGDTEFFQDLGVLINNHRQLLPPKYFALSPSTIAAHIHYSLKAEQHLKSHGNLDGLGLQAELLKIEDDHFAELHGIVPGLRKSSVYNLAIATPDRHGLLRDIFGLVLLSDSSIVRSDIFTGFRLYSIANETATGLAYDSVILETPGGFGQLKRGLNSHITLLNENPHEFVALCNQKIITLRSANREKIEEAGEHIIRLTATGPDVHNLSVRGPDIPGTAYITASHLTDLGCFILQSQFGGRHGKIDNHLQIRIPEKNRQEIRANLATSLQDKLKTI